MIRVFLMRPWIRWNLRFMFYLCEFFRGFLRHLYCWHWSHIVYSRIYWTLCGWHRYGFSSWLLWQHKKICKWSSINRHKRIYDIIIHSNLNSVDMQLTFYCTSVATMWTFVRFFSSMNSNVSFEVRIGFKWSRATFIRANKRRVSSMTT